MRDGRIEGQEVEAAGPGATAGAVS
jgi:hypothetical protein